MGRVHVDITMPLSSCLQQSAIVPDPIVMGHDPASPARKRMTMIIGMLVLTPQAIVQTRKKNVHTLYTMTRPYSSDIGAITSGPRA